MKEYWIHWASPTEPKDSHAHVRFNDVVWEVVTKVKGHCAVDVIPAHLNKYRGAIFLRIFPVSQSPTVEKVLNAPKKEGLGW